MLKDAGGAGEPVNSSGVPSYFLNKPLVEDKSRTWTGKFDVGDIAREYVDAMTDTGMQEQILRNRQRFDKKYQDHQMLMPLEEPLNGKPSRARGNEGISFGRTMAERDAISNIEFLNQYGADINQAMRASIRSHPT